MAALHESGLGTLSPDDCRAEHDRSTRVFQTSDFDLFRDLKGVVDLNAEISHCAFNFLVPKRLGFILRVSYLIESQRSAACRSVLAAAKRSSFRRKKPGQPP